MARRLHRIVGVREQKATDMQKDRVHCLQKSWQGTQGQVGSVEATDKLTPFLSQLSVLLSLGLPTHAKHGVGLTPGCCDVLFSTLH